jgi:hypothetical protein
MVGRFYATTTGGEVARDEAWQDSAIGASGRLRQEAARWRRTTSWSTASAIARAS